jgi:hypothetical protein
MKMRIAAGEGVEVGRIVDRDRIVAAAGQNDRMRGVPNA